MSPLLSRLIIINGSLFLVLGSVAQPLPVVTFTESAGTLTESSTLFPDIIWTPVPGQPYETWLGPPVSTVGYHLGYIEWFEPDGSGLVNRIDGGSFSGPNVMFATSDITQTNVTIAGPPTQQAGAFVTAYVGYVDSIGSIVPILVNFQFIDLGDASSSVPEAQSTMPLFCLGCLGLGLFGIFNPPPRVKYLLQGTKRSRLHPFE